MMMENELPFTTKGDASKPALVLMHGILSSNYQWVHNIEALSEHYYLVLVELWGHGDSPLPEQVSAFSPDNYCRELEVIRHIIGVPQWTLCGQSYAAAIAMHYALKHPKATKAVIITNSNSAASPNADENKHQFLHAIRGVPSLRELPMHPIKATRLDETLKDRLVKYADAVSKTALLGAISYLDDLSLYGRLHAFRTPLLLVNGTQERGFQAQADYLVDKIASASEVKVDAGHAVNLEAPEAFNRAVINFLDAV